MDRQRDYNPTAQTGSSKVKVTGMIERGQKSKPKNVPETNNNYKKGTLPKLYNRNANQINQTCKSFKSVVRVFYY